MQAKTLIRNLVDGFLKICIVVGHNSGAAKDEFRESIFGA